MTRSRPFAHWRQTIQPRHIPRETTASLPVGLPPAFQFSQNSLQDYADCPRRFQLRYVEGIRWPAVESEPLHEHEQLLEQGVEFHLLVQRHLQGIPPDQLTPHKRPLAEWWEAYLKSPPPNLPQGVQLPENQLSTPVGASRLMAKLDLLVVEPGRRVVIVDWKTSRSRPERAHLAQRLQTRVYPYVVAEAGAHLFGGPLEPEQISLVYWFAQAPASPEVFEYSPAQHEDNRAYLTMLVQDILDRREDVWKLTDDESHCRFCIYRSLCNRGVQAGLLDEGSLASLDDAFDFDIDLENVDEIAF
jgi:CRISPR/Cas system-associated exonuclease Cas4 (RecB family)